MCFFIPLGYINRIVVKLASYCFRTNAYAHSFGRRSRESSTSLFSRYKNKRVSQEERKREREREKAMEVSARDINDVDIWRHSHLYYFTSVNHSKNLEKTFYHINVNIYISIYFLFIFYIFIHFILFECGIIKIRNQHVGAQ